jgi:hypothetical protein
MKKHGGVVVKLCASLISTPHEGDIQLKAVFVLPMRKDPRYLLDGGGGVRVSSRADLDAVTKKKSLHLAEMKPLSLSP